MRRPLRAWCAAAVGLGILVGCGKKSSDSVSNSSAPSTTGGSADGGAKSVQPSVAGGKNAGRLPGAPKEEPGTDWTANLPPLTKPPVGEPKTESAPPVEVPPASAPGEIAVTKMNFEGVEKAIAQAKGKVVLIDCWATWCPPCVASFPKLVEKHEKYNSKGLAVISLSTDKPADAPKVIAFLKKNKAAFTNLHVPIDQALDQQLRQKFEYKGGIPHAVLFDRTGKRVWSGHPMDPKLTPQIEAELAKSGGERS